MVGICSFGENMNLASNSPQRKWIYHSNFPPKFELSVEPVQKPLLQARQLLT